MAGFEEKPAKVQAFRNRRTIVGAILNKIGSFAGIACARRSPEIKTVFLQ
jgi:hypothetical protein